MRKKTAASILLVFLCGIIGLFAGPAPIIQASIVLVSTMPFPEHPEWLQPGKPALLKALIKNNGESTSIEGSVFIRFVLPKALAHLGAGVFFETEKEALPALVPGQEMEIVFKTLLPLPDIAEFFKNDWPMRLYEAVALFDQEEMVIGMGAISCSAHYYQGPQKALPAIVPQAF